MANLEKTIPSSSANNLDIARYTANTECVATSNIVATSDVEWLENITTANGKITIGTVSANTNSESRSGNVTVSYSYPSGGRSVACNQIIEVTQQGSSCNCDSLVLVEKKVIPQSGDTGGLVILSYTSTTNCDDITFTESEGKLSLTTNKIVSTQGWVKYDVELTNKVEENTSASSINYTIVMNVNGSPCLGKNQQVEQLGADCTCESINSRFVYVESMMPTSGTGGEEIMILSADTEGCGTIEARDQPGEEGILEPYGDKLARVETNGNYVYVYAIGNAWTDETKVGWESVTLNFKIITTDGNECENVYKTIYQCSDSGVTCDDLFNNYCKAREFTITNYRADGSAYTPYYLCFGDAPTTGTSPYYKVEPDTSETVYDDYQWYQYENEIYISPRAKTLSSLCCSGDHEEVFYFKNFITDGRNNIIKDCGVKSVSVTFKEISCENKNVVGWVLMPETGYIFEPTSATTAFTLLFTDCFDYTASIEYDPQTSPTNILSAEINGNDVIITSLGNQTTEEIKATLKITATGKSDCSDSGCGSYEYELQITVRPNVLCSCNQIKTEIVEPNIAYNINSKIYSLKDTIASCSITSVTVSGYSYKEGYNRLNVTRTASNNGVLFIDFDGYNFTDKDEYVKITCLANDCLVIIELTREKYEFTSCEVFKNTFTDATLAANTKVLDDYDKLKVDNEYDLLTFTAPKGSESCFTFSVTSQQDINTFLENYRVSIDRQTDKDVYTFKGTIITPPTIPYTFSLNAAADFSGITFSTTTTEYKIIPNSVNN